MSWRGASPVYALLGLLACSPGLCQAQLSAAAQGEINVLLRAVGDSGCAVLRGSSVHTAAEAQRHLNMKYEYLATRSLLTSTEDFIDKAATRSSMTGEAYAIRCGELAPVPTGAWLRARLHRMRQAAVTH